MTDNRTDDRTGLADPGWPRGSTTGPPSPFQRARFAYFDTHVDTWHRKQVLDIGFGGARTAEFLGRRGAFVSGIDLAPDLPRRHAEITGGAVDYGVGATTLPYPDESFDIVTCADALDRTADPARALREIARVLVPGGILCFAAVNRTLRSRIVMVWIPGHIAAFGTGRTRAWREFITPRELRRYLDDAGLVGIGRLRGLSILGRWNGELVVRETGDLSSVYLGVAHKPY